MSLKSFGEVIRERRELRGMMLRELASRLSVDTAILSKAERGERKLTKEQVIRLAAIIEIPEGELITLWLSDKVNKLLKDEPTAKDVLHLSLKYLSRK